MGEKGIAIKKKVSTLIGVNRALTRLFIARQMIDNAWPELVGNDDKYTRLLQTLYDSINKMQDVGEEKLIQAIERVETDLS